MPTALTLGDGSNKRATHRTHHATLLQSTRGLIFEAQFNREHTNVRYFNKPKREPFCLEELLRSNMEKCNLKQKCRRKKAKRSGNRFFFRGRIFFVRFFGCPFIFSRPLLSQPATPVRTALIHLTPQIAYYSPRFDYWSCIGDDPTLLNCKIESVKIISQNEPSGLLRPHMPELSS